MPNPFTDDEVESIREIIGLGTSSAEATELDSKCSALNGAQVTRTKRDIARWDVIAYGTTRQRGGIKGNDFSLERDRLLITNRVRERMNYPQVESLDDPDSIGMVRLSLGGGSWCGDENSR
jgi:hypothetical protein